MYALTGRLHRSNCKRIQNANGFVRSEAQPAGDLSAHDVHLLALATCCKPNPAALELLVQEALEAEQSDAEVYTAEARAAADDSHECSTLCTGDGHDCGAPGPQGECTLHAGHAGLHSAGSASWNDSAAAEFEAEGYVPNERGRASAVARQDGLDSKQAAGTVDRVRGRKSGDPREDRARSYGDPALDTAAAEILAAAPEGQEVQRCTGACAQVLPLVKFPTVTRKDGKGRGTECRGCRDARREVRAAK